MDTWTVSTFGLSLWHLALLAARSLFISALAYFYLTCLFLFFPIECKLQEGHDLSQLVPCRLPRASCHAWHTLDNKHLLNEQLCVGCCYSPASNGCHLVLWPLWASGFTVLGFSPFRLLPGCGSYHNLSPQPWPSCMIPVVPAQTQDLA